ncbi:hypothetical protein NC653_023038 [Populus alba x Populus x berolinensis]|uniref:Uncharacterized protein n=1 Tax=Populus alba x Populus x berolinensis TaxID=444605 RepID=A0AAD6QA59_9ROSI|nr:hypothetical protein NC653_023038 [Populus alba x Populus x berolinensis]
MRTIQKELRLQVKAAALLLDSQSETDSPSLLMAAGLPSSMVATCYLAAVLYSPFIPSILVMSTLVFSFLVRLAFRQYIQDDGSLTSGL